MIRTPEHCFRTTGLTGRSILSSLRLDYATEGSIMATRATRSTSRGRRRTIFFPPRHKKLADIISIESPAAFRESIRRLKRMGIGPTEKRALVLAQNRAKAMLKKRNLSAKERRELQAIARMPLPAVEKKAA